jgi:Na+-transporting methylmalonyl-CoA/oxaloacetate decarboxylase gamma subunit
MSEAAQFGLTMLVVGMGGTLLTLLGLVLILWGLTAIFPVEKPPADKIEPEAKP